MALPAWLTCKRHIEPEAVTGARSAGMKKALFPLTDTATHACFDKLRHFSSARHFWNRSIENSFCAEEIMWALTRTLFFLTFKTLAGHRSRRHCSKSITTLGHGQSSSVYCVPENVGEGSHCNSIALKPGAQRHRLLPGSCLDR